MQWGSQAGAEGAGAEGAVHCGSQGRAGRLWSQVGCRGVPAGLGAQPGPESRE